MQIDTNYLLALGPQALPAIDKAIELLADDHGSDLSARRYCLVSRRDRLVEQQGQDLTWRAWGFRSWRLQRRLDAEASGRSGSQPAG